MSRFFLVPVVITVLYSCSSKDRIPKDIISRQQMREIVWDMTRISEFLNSFVFPKDSTLDKIAESEKWYAKVYQLHKTTKEEFDRSYTFYREHPDLMKELLDSLSKKTMPVRPLTPVKDSTSFRDSIRKRTPPPFQNDLQKKIIDSMKKRRILKKEIAKPV